METLRVESEWLGCEIAGDAQAAFLGVEQRDCVGLVDEGDAEEVRAD